jgi:hypothetical protein
MQEFHGELLIGGLRLQHVQVELEEDLLQSGADDASLSGHLHLSPEQVELLELNRQYRLQLENGPAGQVVLSGFAPAEDELVADFQPTKPR